MLGRVSQAFEPKPISQLQLEREHGVSGAVRRRHRVAARRVREGRLQADRGVQGEQVHRQGGSGKGQSSRWRGAARRAKLSEFILSDNWNSIPFNNFGVILRCFKFRLSVELRKGSAPDWL